MTQEQQDLIDYVYNNLPSDSELKVGIFKDIIEKVISLDLVNTQIDPGGGDASGTITLQGVLNNGSVANVSKLIDIISNNFTVSATGLLQLKDTSNLTLENGSVLNLNNLGISGINGSLDLGNDTDILITLSAMLIQDSVLNMDNSQIDLQSVQISGTPETISLGTPGGNSFMFHHGQTNPGVIEYNGTFLKLENGQIKWSNQINTGYSTALSSSSESTINVAKIAFIPLVDWENLQEVDKVAGTFYMPITFPSGPEGSVGPEGSIGLPGPEGPEGPQGPFGPEGIQGIEGPIGLDGPIGPGGPIGLTGDKGDSGISGPQGESGIEGTPGTSIGSIKGEYPTEEDLNIAHPTGNIGDGYLIPDSDPCSYFKNLWIWDDINAKWVNVGRVQGPKGQEGPIGPEGKGLEFIWTGDKLGVRTQGDLTWVYGPSLTGPEGIPGPVGPEGIQGDQGPQGLEGQLGLVGPEGTEGDKGDQGIPGSIGPEGPQGPPGMVEIEGLGYRPLPDGGNTTDTGQTFRDDIDENEIEITDLQLEVSNIHIPEIVDALTSTFADKTLSANMGRVLMSFIDDINVFLNGDDINLDQIKEIADYIKQNASDLENLTIPNIAGLLSALAGKEDKFSKNTAFNKNFGTGQNDVMPGNFVLAIDKTNWNAKETPAGAQAKANAKVEDQIINGVIDKAPSQNVVFDKLAGKVDDSQVLTDVPPGALFTDNDTVYDDTTIQNEVTNNSDARHSHLNKPTLDNFGENVNGLPTYNGVKVDTTIAQRDVYDGLNSTDNTISLAANRGKELKDVQDTQQTAINLNTVKETNIGHPLVETAVPVGAVFTDTDTVYDDTNVAFTNVNNNFTDGQKTSIGGGQIANFNNTAPGTDITMRYGYAGYGWIWKYEGSGAGNNNKHILYSEGAGGVDVQVYEMTQDGNTIFSKNLSALNLSGTNTGDQDLSGKVDNSQVLTNVPAGAVFTDTDTVYDDTAIQSEVTDNTNARHTHLNKPTLDNFGEDVNGLPTYNGVKVDTTIAQRDVYDGLDSLDNTISLSANNGKVLKDVQDTQQTAINLNTAKETNIGHPLVEKAVPVNALFTDTVYDDSDVVKTVNSIVPDANGDVTIGSSLLTKTKTYTSGAQTITADFDIVQVSSLVVGNSFLQEGTQYTVSGAVVTITDTLTSGAVIQLKYWKANAVNATNYTKAESNSKFADKLDKTSEIQNLKAMPETDYTNLATKESTKLYFLT